MCAEGGAGHAREARQRQAGRRLGALGDEHGDGTCLPVGHRLELDEYGLVDGQRVRVAAAHGLESHRVNQALRAEARRQGRRLGGAGGAGRRESWLGENAEARRRRSGPGDGSAITGNRERDAWLGRKAAERKLASDGL